MGRLARELLGTILLLAVGTTVLVEVRALADRPNVYSPNHLPGAIPAAQTSALRKWRSFEWKELDRLNSSDVGMEVAKLELAGPSRLVVFDGSDYSIKRVAIPSLELVSNTPIPDQALRSVSLPVVDMASDGSSAWISNPNGNVVRIDLETGGFDAFSLRGHRLAAVSRRLVLMRPPGHERLFAVLDASGHLALEFGEFFENQARDAVALDGVLATDQESRIFFAPYYGGFLASYDIAGRRLFLVELIDPMPAPTIRQSRGSLSVIYDDGANSVIDLAVSGDALYALVRISGVGANPKTVLDIYDADTGSYTYSIRAPERTKSVDVAAGVMYALVTEGIVAWRFSEGVGSKSARRGASRPQAPLGSQ